MGKRLDAITILRDSREKENKGWEWEPQEKVPGKIQILGTKDICLDAADYSIEGKEDLVRIERKQGFCELFNNLMSKDHRERFERELEKLRKVKHKYIIVESSLNEDLLGLSIPQYRFAAPPLSKITDMLFKYQIDFDIHPIFAGSCGKKMASQILKNIARKYCS